MLELLKQDAKVGDSLNLYLTSGNSVKGTIVEIGENYLHMEVDGVKRRYFPQLIGGWEVVNDVSFNAIGGQFGLVRDLCIVFVEIFREMFFNHSNSQLHAEKFWKIKEARNFFSGKEFAQLLESLDEDSLTDDQRYNLYDRFFEADYDVTANYVSKKYASVLLRGMGLRIISCVLLSSPHRFQEFLKELASDAKWGVRWAELVLPREDYHHATITRLLSRLPVRIIKEFYVWLNVHFPPEKEPYHEGAYSPNDTDNIYRAKTFVFNELMSRIEPEAVDAVEELQRRFPKGKWFHDCALRLQHKLLAVRCPIFSADVVRKLLEGKKRMLVINDEAHHCYLPKADKTKLTADDDDASKENESAMVWYEGLRQTFGAYIPRPCARSTHVEGLRARRLSPHRFLRKAHSSMTACTSR